MRKEDALQILLLILGIAIFMIPIPVVGGAGASFILSRNKFAQKIGRWVLRFKAAHRMYVTYLTGYGRLYNRLLPA